MALSLEQQIKLLKAEKQAINRDRHKMVDLLEYYRGLVPDNGSRSGPPAHYWVKPGQDKTVWGRIVHGELEPLGKSRSREDAIDACWGHLAEETHRTDSTARKIKESGIDFSDLKEETPVRRRRRVTNE